MNVDIYTDHYSDSIASYVSYVIRRYVNLLTRGLPPSWMCPLPGASGGNSPGYGMTLVAETTTGKSPSEYDLLL